MKASGIYEILNGLDTDCDVRVMISNKYTDDLFDIKEIDSQIIGAEQILILKLDK